MVEDTDGPDADSREAKSSKESQRSRQCPWCRSRDVRLTQRGFTGPTDERDQYFLCNNCKRLTYEIISRSTRDMRLGQYRTGGTYRDTVRQTKYDITRVLKVGSNEFLLYVKPIVRATDNSRPGFLRRGRY